MIKYKKPIKICIIFIFIFTFLSIFYFIHLFEKSSYISKNKSTILKTEVTKSISNLKEVKGITNILLIGCDARNLKENSRSDAIMILTIDEVHKKLKLTSIMRDSYVKIPGHAEQKITHSLAYGGTDLLINTIESNFNIKLDKFVLINFFGFKDLIDSIGGLNINIKPNEVHEINKCIKLLYKNNPHLIKTYGTQHLDGQQVLSYSRIRHVGNGSYERTERQRKVISLIIDKLKDTPILKYPMLASKILPYMKTNLSINEILNCSYTVHKINNFNISQLQIPLNELSYSKLYGNKGWVLLMDKPQNAKILNNYIFQDKTYNKSSLDYSSYKSIINNYLLILPKTTIQSKISNPKIYKPKVSKDTQNIKNKTIKKYNTFKPPVKNTQNTSKKSNLNKNLKNNISENKNHDKINNIKNKKIKDKKEEVPLKEVSSKNNKDNTKTCETKIENKDSVPKDKINENNTSLDDKKNKVKNASKETISKKEKNN